MAIGRVAAGLCDGLARILIACRVKPNAITAVGVIFAACAGVWLIMGAGHAPPWEAGRAPTPTSVLPLMAAVMLILAGACDILDGAVARVGNQRSPFGALFDSTLDRFSDLFIFGGCALHFCLVGNITYALLSVTAAANAVLISYVKARAEHFIEHCGVGYWQRGERYGMILLAVCLGRVPAALWVLGTLPILTVISRLTHAHRVMTGSASSESMAAGPSPHRLVPRRDPRRSAGYLISLALLATYLFAGPLLWPALYGESDPVGTVLRQLIGA
jgi:CDP-diacylglycerol--glycerol-3-phosphate 3-phosphatidyltransferase